MRTIFLLFLLSISSLGWSQTITLVAVSDVWPEFANPEEKQQGFIIEVARAALNHQGYTLEVDFVPWTRALDRMKHNTADLLIGTWYTEERNKYLYFSQPIFQSPVRFLKRKEDPFEFTDLKSLTGLRVGTILSYTYQQDFLQANNFERLQSHDLINNIHHLIAGRIDLTLDDQYVSKYTLNKYFENWQEQLSFVENPLIVKDIFLASSRSNLQHKSIIHAFNKGLNALKKSGRYDEILSRYDFINRFSSSSS